MARRVTLSLPALLVRFAPVFLIALSVLFLGLNSVAPHAVQSWRASVTNHVAPVFALLAAPKTALHSAGTALDNFWQTYDENTALRAENARLKEWQAQALSLAATNAALRDQLKTVAETPADRLTARLIFSSGHGAHAEAVLNAGREHGVQKNAPVFSQNGVVGRVLDVGAQTSRILLLTDPLSRIPVMLSPSGERAILAGQAEGPPILTHLDPQADLGADEFVFTAAEGGVFAAGLPIGQIVDTNADDLAVRPFANLSRLSYVQIVLPPHTTK